MLVFASREEASDILQLSNDQVAKEAKEAKLDKKQEQEEYERKVEQMKAFVDNDWFLKRFEGQTTRDAETWLATLKRPGLESRGNILRRLFTVLRYGGLMFRHKSDSKDEKDTKWRFWYETKWPIATAMSHGGRIVIQLPRKKSNIQSTSQYDSSFWKWLVTGEREGDLSQHVSTSTSGDQCQKEHKLIFKRLGATHALDFVKPFERVTVIPHVNPALPAMERVELLFPALPQGKKKVLVECKTSGFNLRDTTMFRGDMHTLKQHRHWGMNIPLGGFLNSRMTVKSVRSDGTNGHVYFYRMPATESTFGGIMVGLEGSEWGKKDVAGGYHGMSAKSTPYSPTYGYKWHSKEHTDLTDTKGPGKYDCMYVDLTDGWDVLRDLYVNDWRDEFVTQTSLPLPQDPHYKEFISTMENVIPARRFTLDDFPQERLNAFQQKMSRRHFQKYTSETLKSKIVFRTTKLLSYRAKGPYKTYEEVTQRNDWK